MFYPRTKFPNGLIKLRNLKDSDDDDDSWVNPLSKTTGNGLYEGVVHDEEWEQRPNMKLNKNWI